MAYLTKGTVLNCPAGGGYILTRDVDVGEPYKASQLEAFGGVGPVRAGEPFPDWLGAAIRKAHNDQC